MSRYVTVEQVVGLVDKIVEQTQQACTMVVAGPEYTMYLVYDTPHDYSRTTVMSHNDLHALIKQGQAIVASLTPNYLVEIYQDLHLLPENEGRDHLYYIRHDNRVAIIRDEGLTIV